MTEHNTHTYILSQNKEVKYFEVTLPSGELGYAYMLQPGAEFDLSGVKVAQMSLYDGDDKGDASGNLLLATDDGQPGIVIWNFKELAESANPPFIILPDGSKVTADQLSNQLTNVFDIEPAAGPESSPAAVGDGGFTQPGVLSTVYNAPGILSAVPGAAFAGPAAAILPAEDLRVTQNFVPPVVVGNPPVAGPDAFVTPEDVPLNLTNTILLANDSDPDGDPVSIIGVAATSTQGGTISFNPATGAILYTPATNFNGVDTFTYTITDGNGNNAVGVVTVTVTPVNDAPDAVNDARTTNEDTPVTIAVLGNDTDPEGDPLTVTATTNPANGTIVVNAGGTITYTPNANFNGVDTFTYTITDGNGGFDTATVTITVNPVNDAPDAVNDAAVTNEDTPVTIAVLGNDTDPDGDPLTVVGTTNPANGTIVVNPGGTITYTPNANFNGVDTFTYTISDGNGGTDTATVNITINPIDDPVDAVNDAATTNENTPVSVSLLANDSAPDGGLAFVSNTNPANGTVTVNPATGVATYTPNLNFNGVDTFTYTVRDADGDLDTATVTITVNNVDQPVDAVNDAATTAEDTPVAISLLANDSAPDGGLAFVSNTNPANGTVTVNPATGVATYTPNANFNGVDTFTYTVRDADGDLDTATVTITVTPVNDAPDAVNDARTTNEDTPVTIAVLGNDTDPDGDPLTVTATTNPANGTIVVNAGGTITYTPNANFNGVDTFTYTISDGNGGTDTATVTITVNPINDAPDAVNDSANTTAGVPVTVGVLTNDTDPDGDPLTVTATTNPANGSIVVNAGGTISYTPNAGFTGTDTFTYTITDGNGGFDTATVTINVAAAPISHNVTLVVDTSSSMHDVMAGTGQTGFQLMKGAITNLVNSYQALGQPVTFTVINYAETATTTTFGLNNFAGVTNFVNALGQTGVQTFTEVALSTAQAHLAGVVAGTPTSATQINEVFFVSDGFVSSGHGITLPAGQAYQQFIGDNGIASHAVGLGNSPTGVYDLVDLDNTGANFQQITAANQLFTTGAQTGDFGASTNVSGTGGADVLHGNGGNDFIDGGAGADQIFAGAGFDTIVWNNADTIINGGSGVDTLKVSTDNSTINLSEGRFQQIERIDLENGVAGNQVILTSADVLRVSDDNIIAIKGDAGDSVTATGFGAKLGNLTGSDGTVYALYNDAGSGASLLVELGLNLNGSVVV